jgi:hypothetical protein
MVNSKASKLNRRVVLKTAAGIGVGLASGFSAHANDLRSSDLPPSESPKGSAAADWLGRADEAFFNQHVDSLFEFWSVRGRASALLRSVQTYVGERKNESMVHAFALTFVIQESTRTTPAELCNVTHPKLGTFELFVTEANSVVRGERLLIATFARPLA